MSFCRNCGAELNENADFCVKCGSSAGKGNKFCYNCGAETNPEQAVCLKCGVQLTSKAAKKSGSGGNSIGSNGKLSGFTRISDGKILGGVCTGIEEQFGMNRWISRVLFLILPFVWIIYLVACLATEIR